MITSKANTHAEFFIGKVLNDDDFYNKVKNQIQYEILSDGMLKDIYELVVKGDNSLENIFNKRKDLVPYAMHLANQAASFDINIKESKLPNQFIE